MLTFNDYQNSAYKYAIYQTPYYPFLALAEEAGEVAGKVAKHMRVNGTTMFHSDGVQDDNLRTAIAKELGDVLWQVQACAAELGMTLEDIALYNLAKLADRAKRNVLSGEGDDR